MKNQIRTNIEGLDIDQAIIKAGFDYKVDPQPLQYLHNNEVQTDCSKNVLTNSVSGEVFNVVSNKYKTVQPAEILEFYRDLTQKNGLTLKTAGVLKGGAKVYAIASFDEAPKERCGDIVSKNLMLSTSCDGTQSTRASIHFERLICTNGMTTPDEKHLIKVSHATDFDADKVLLNMGIVKNSQENFNNIFDALIETKVNDKMAFSIIHGIMGKKNTIEDESTRNQRIIGKIFNLYKNSIGSNLSTCDHTLWGILNGFTYYVDHVQGNSNETRTNNAFFGTGNKLKNDAMSILRDVAEKHQSEIQTEYAYESNNALEILDMN